MIIDFHSHILPGMDDGAKNVEISLEMLEKEKADGVDLVVLTPHLYLHNEKGDEFLKRRAESYKELTAAAEGRNLPELRLGAEVYFTPALAEMDAKPFCIEGTDYLLLEMPYETFTTSTMNLLKDFVAMTDVRPVMAHIERYLSFNKEKTLYEILSMEVLGQMNCQSLIPASIFDASAKKAYGLLKSGGIHVIGSDAHNNSSRPVRMKTARENIIKKAGENVYEQLMDNAERILGNVAYDDLIG